MAQNDERLQEVVTTKGVLMASKVTPAEEAYGGPEHTPRGVEGHFLYEVPGKAPVIAKPVPQRAFSMEDQKRADEMAASLPAKIQERGAYRNTLNAMSEAMSMRNGQPPAMNEAAIQASFEAQQGKSVYAYLEDVRRERELDGMAKAHGQEQESGHDPV